MVTHNLNQEVGEGLKRCDGFKGALNNLVMRVECSVADAGAFIDQAEEDVRRYAREGDQ